jgi:hypothetical protein
MTDPRANSHPAVPRLDEWDYLVVGQTYVRLSAVESFSVMRESETAWWLYVRTLSGREHRFGPLTHQDARSAVDDLGLTSLSLSEMPYRRSAAEVAHDLAVQEAP